MQFAFDSGTPGLCVYEEVLEEVQGDRQGYPEMLVLCRRIFVSWFYRPDSFLRDL